jgi:glycerol-3-phosphate acyltransferase PlsY
MATSLGALLIYDYKLALVLALLFGAAFAAVRKTVLPGLFALTCLPLMSWYLAHSPAELVGTSVLAGVVLLAHRQNLVTELSHFLDRRNIHPRHHPPEL